MSIRGLSPVAADAAHDDRDDLPRPWERPGAVRRDCEPHRGQLLRVLGAVSLVCGILSLMLAVSGVIGLPLAVAVLVLSGRDLARMRRGLLDPAGRVETERAWVLALEGLVLSVVGPLIHGVLVLWLMAHRHL
jgi:hypothetical protein